MKVRKSNHDDGSSSRSTNKSRKHEQLQSAADEFNNEENNSLAVIKVNSVQETCDFIAELSESVLEDPEQAFKATDRPGFNDPTIMVMKGPSKIRQLIDIASQQENAMDYHTAQLAMMSLLAIFKDILPAYRIRLPTASEMSIKVSKETKKLWDHERSLLQHYQLYLKLLESTWENGKSKLTSVAITAVLALAELLKSAFHFNFRSNLLQAVVRQMNNGQSDAISKACCESIEYVFANDSQGDVALEATRQVAKMVKDRGLNVKPAVVKVFLTLPLRVHVDEAEAAKLASQVNAKKRKRDKELAEIEAELKEGNATVDKIALAKCQSEMLQTIMLTYFRILKSDSRNSSHIAKLLPPALEGLAKFSHLVNIDTVVDLLAVLKNLIKSVDNLPLDAVLNCILTSFQTLQGPGRELKIDQKEYIMPLYIHLPRLSSEENSLNHTETMIKCLTYAFINRREYSTTRVASFLKQICTTAMHAPAHTGIPLLVFARHLIQRYPSAEQMLENEQDVITCGEYKADVDDPELTNAFATSAWELASLKFHINKGVAEQAIAAASMKMLQLPGDDPQKMHASLLVEYNDLYISFKRNMKKHPLATNETSTSSNSKKKQSQVRFIKPRSFQSKYNEN